jgi:predicted transcriptional regulator
MINKYEAGITKAKIAKEYGLIESTVRHILDHAANYKQQKRKKKFHKTILHQFLSKKA